MASVGASRLCAFAWNATVTPLLIGSTSRAMLSMNDGIARWRFEAAGARVVARDPPRAVAGALHYPIGDPNDSSQTPVPVAQGGRPACRARTRARGSGLRGR